MRRFWRITVLFIISLLVGVAIQFLPLRLVLKLLFVGLLTTMISTLLLKYYNIESLRFREIETRFKILGNIFLDRFDFVNSKKSVFVWAIALCVFVFNFWLQLTYQGNTILSGILHIVVHPFNFLIQEGLLGAFSHRFFQVNSYTGNPFFLLPFVYMLGYTPDAFRIVLLSVVAATSAIYFRVYYEVLDLKKAVLGTLILTSMSFWIFYWWPDYDYTDLFFAILLFLYFRWLNVDLLPRSRYVYLLSFVSGLFFYFKATVAYMVISIGAAGLYYKRDNLLEFVKGFDYLKLVVLFLIGVSPFFAYNAFNTEILVNDGFSFAGSEDLEMEEVAVKRFEQLDHWLRSSINIAPSISDGSQDAFSSTEIFGFHAFSIILLFSIPFLILARSHIQLVIIFVVFFFLLFFLPSDGPVALHPMTVLVPLVPLIAMAVLDTVPDRIEQNLFYRIAFWSILFLIALNVVGDITNNPNTAAAIPENTSLKNWGGAQVFYSDFEELDISQPVLTNSYKVHVITNYFLEIKGSEFILPRKLRGNTRSLEGLSETGGRRNVISYYQGQEKRNRTHSSVDFSKPVTIVLRRDLPCMSGEEICGIKFENALNEFNLTRDEVDEVYVENEAYFVARNMTLNKTSN